LLNRLLSQLPRGFGNFRSRREAQQKQTEEGKSEDESGEKSGKSEDTTDKAKEEDVDDSKSDDSKPGGPEDNNALYLIGAALAMGYLLYSSTKNEEITFQQFKTDLLMTGQVDKLEVVRKDTVEVFLRDPVTKTPRPSRYYFQIGSVEAFERQLAEAQRELQIDPRDFVPVQYVNRTTADLMGNVFSLILPFLLLPLLLSMSGMGGMGGGLSNLKNFFKSGRKGLKGGSRGPGSMFGLGRSNAIVIRPGDKV